MAVWLPKNAASPVKAISGERPGRPQSGDGGWGCALRLASGPSIGWSARNVVTWCRKGAPLPKVPWRSSAVDYFASGLRGRTLAAKCSSPSGGTQFLRRAGPTESHDPRLTPDLHRPCNSPVSRIGNRV